MLILLSPSKTLDLAPPVISGKITQPEFLDEAAVLADVLRKKTRPQLAKLMSISPKLSEQVAGYYKNWKTPFTAKNAHPALLTFRGDVYEGLAAEDFNAADRSFAQKHLRILSGLYGILRPLDRMQPYRLEMGCRLASGGKEGFKNLYDFWGDQVRENLEIAAKRKKQPLVNLASGEYFKVVQPAKIELRVVTPVFKEKKGKNYKVVSFFAKKARGQMARYIVKQRLEEPEEMQAFAEDGYRFNGPLSSEDEFVFTRG
ncbi:MAG: peroxide stress protein YaaA [Planctomycetota bacterium]|nr:peroxide stress protein YaaA [Planctomycetota bacterium]